ncbi:MAG: hypothetical protein ACPLKX_08855 [Dictyoglomaceae bacterium]|nr:MAG: hypothetical protein C0196_01520 [Dictyoglomus turgidum]
MRIIKSLIFFFLIYLLVIPFSLAQTEENRLLISSNKLPSWVKPGLALVYQYQGGAGTGKGGDFSGATYQGYNIFVITNIEKNIAYGLKFHITKSISSGYLSYDASVKALNGLVYLDPKEIEDEVRKSKTAGLPPGVKNEVGSAGNNLYYYLYESSDWQSMTRFFIIYDKDGVIQKISILEKQGNNSSAVSELKLLGIYKISLPPINTMPLAVKTSPTYQIYSSVSLFGGAYSSSAPFGTVRYALASSSGSILLFNSQLTTSQNMSTSSKLYGNFYMGPFYIHPQLLKTDIILKISEINFYWEVLGNGQYGGVLTQIQVNGVPIAQFEYDVNTGLLLSANIPQGEGMYMIPILLNR